MTLELASVPAQSPAPTLQPDLRPTADTAALVRDPRPDIPMPIPASTGQTAAVVESKVTSSNGVSPVEATERVLKPYGVAMLPDMAKLAESPKEEGTEQATSEKKDVSGKDVHRLDKMAMDRNDKSHDEPPHEAIKSNENTKPVGQDRKSHDD